MIKGSWSSQTRFITPAKLARAVLYVMASMVTSTCTNIGTSIATHDDRERHSFTWVNCLRRTLKKRKAHLLDIRQMCHLTFELTGAIGHSYIRAEWNGAAKRRHAPLLPVELMVSSHYLYRGMPSMLVTLIRSSSLWA